MHFGYARVSTDEQDTSSQVEQLKKAGCEEKNIFTENASGGNYRDRPQLQRLLDYVRQDDVIVVRSLDRLSRSLSDLLFILDKLDHRGVGFKSLSESIDTSTAVGRMMTHIIGAFAEFERGIIRERTKAGLKAARAKGVHLGGKIKLSRIERAAALRMIADGKTQAEVAQECGVDRSTISRLVSQSKAVNAP